MQHDDIILRRKNLLKQLDKSSIAIIPAAIEHIRNGDVRYTYRQDSNFHYLTGFPESDSVAVFVAGKTKDEYILFTNTADKDQEVWHGPCISQESACKDYGATKAFAMTELDTKMVELLTDCKQIYYDFGKNKRFDERLIGWINKIKTKAREVNSPDTFKSLEPYLQKMRSIKTPFEIERIKYATDVSTKAHLKAIKRCRPEMMEYQLGAEILHEFYSNGCLSPAYDIIVGAGKNSCVLHYSANNEMLKDGDLVLIDAGAEYKNYASDLTRTFPINGRFNKEQRAIYEIVLSAQKAGIKEVYPGNAWDRIQTVMVQIITEGLVELCLLKGDIDTLIEKKEYQTFYPHQSGHWLGLDVHDSGKYKIDDTWCKLEPGMVLTVEPGIYINASTVSKEWQNIGVRIEDTILVTETGFEILSKDLPKEISGIEELMKRK